MHPLVFHIFRLIRMKELWRVELPGKVMNQNTSGNEIISGEMLIP